MYIGDFIKENGPSTVDISVRKSFLKLSTGNIYYIQSTNVLNFKTIMCYLKSDIIHISGTSFGGLLFIILSRIMFKKTSMTMHGSLLIEKKYRSIPKRRIFFEWLQVKLVNKIFPVSQLLSDEIKISKSVVIPNGIYRQDVEFQKIKKEKGSIILIGGGRKEKRHIDVCKIINDINTKYNLNLHVYIYGEKGPDSRWLNEYEFVTDFGFCTKDTLEKAFQKAEIFIQYSTFETFSLAVTEAINSRCKIITSDKVGINSFIDISDDYQVVSSNGQLEDAIINMVNTKTGSYIKDKLLSWDDVALMYYKNWNEL